MQAQKGIEEMKESVDTLIIVSNDKLRDLYGNSSLSEAFSKADDILTTAAKGIAEIITVPGYVNVDFEDVGTVMRNSGVAIMGTGVADGGDRAMKAVKAALSSPLLNENDIRGAKHILLNISSGTKEVLMDEVGDITNYIQEAAGYTSEVIWGNCTDDGLGDKLSVTVIATGFEGSGSLKEDINAFERESERREPRIVMPLDDKPKRKEIYTPKTAEKKRVYSFDDEYPTDMNQKKVEPIREERFTRRTSRTNMNEEDRMRVFMERKKRLRGLSMKLQQNDLSELEREPAYKRRNIKLEDMPHSSESNVSKYSLFEDEKKRAELKKRNPFLHDNID